MSLPLDGGPGDQDHAGSETDTAIPDDDDDMAFLASCTFESLQPSCLQPLGSLPFGVVCIWPAMAFSGDFAGEFVPRSPVSPFCLELENIFEDHGVSWQNIDEMLALEVETYRRCFPPRPALSASQRYNRRKCALLLLDLAAAANLPPHGALFSQQLLDPTHREWTERADTDIDINDIHSSQPQSTFTSSCILRGIQVWPHSSFQTLCSQPARSLTDLLTALHYCTQPGRSNKLSQKSVVSWSQFTMSLARPHWRLGFKSARSASLCGASSASSVFRSLLARSSRAFPLVLASGAQGIADVYVPNQPFSLESRPSCIGSSAWFLSCATAERSHGKCSLRVLVTIRDEIMYRNAEGPRWHGPGRIVGVDHKVLWTLQQGASVAVATGRGRPASVSEILAHMVSGDRVSERAVDQFTAHGTATWSREHLRSTAGAQ